MAIIQVSGPAFIYVSRTVPASTPSAASILFLGTCEQPPTLQLNPQWEPVMNDQGGSLLPIDYTYQGEDGLISGTLNKWNEQVYLNLASHGLSQGVAARGKELWSDVGTVSQLEAITFQTYVVFPYASKNPFAANGMPTCYRFLATRLAGHVIGPGTRAGRRQLILHTDRALSETGVASTTNFKLYDNTLGNCPATTPPIGATGGIV